MQIFARLSLPLSHIHMRLNSANRANERHGHHLHDAWRSNSPYALNAVLGILVGLGRPLNMEPRLKLSLTSDCFIDSNVPHITSWIPHPIVLKVSGATVIQSARYSRWWQWGEPSRTAAGQLIMATATVHHQNALNHQLHQRQLFWLKGMPS